MGTYIGAWNVPANGTFPIFAIPPGQFNLVFWNATTTATNVYIGTTVNVTANDGLQCHSIPTTIQCNWMATRGQQLYAVNTAASTVVPIQYVLTTTG